MTGVKIIDKRVKIPDLSINDAFALMGVFSEEARKQGWTSEEINRVCDEAMSGDYLHLVGTLALHVSGTDADEDGEE